MIATLLRLVLAAVALAAWSGAAGAQAEKRLALVVGNSAYPEAPLRNPANDARAMARVLRERGFEVILRENATKAQLTDAVADFGEKLTEGSTGLFFFAGHGMQVQGRNFLIPVDARITSEQRVRLETLDVDMVLDQMAAARVRVSMVILDACRNNPFERRFRSVGGGLAQINAPEGTLIAYATAPGKVAADGDSGNGLYTAELLKAMAQPGLKVEDVFKQVRVNVSRASNGAQVPWEASSLMGDFYFRAPAPAAAAPAPAGAPPALAPVDREALFWDSIKNSNNVGEVRSYLDQFPTGTFAGLARARIAALETAPRPEPEARAGGGGGGGGGGGRRRAGNEFAALPPAEFTTDFRGPPVGLRISYNTGGVSYVTAVEGRTVVVANENGDRTSEFVGGFAGWRRQGGGVPPTAIIETLYPLAPDKQITFSLATNNPGNPRTYTMKVLRRETVTVQAGTFDCFVIEVHERSARGDFAQRYRHWYAPGIGIVVKREYEALIGMSPFAGPSWEVTDLRVTR